MQGQDQKSSPALSDFEAPNSFGLMNGDALASEEAAEQEFRHREAREQSVARLRRLWNARTFLGRVAGIGLILSTLLAFIIPNQYESVARLMPPDNQSGAGGLAMAAAALSGGASGLGDIAGEFMGLKGSSELLVGVLRSRTVEDQLIRKFELKKVYGYRRMQDARKVLENQTEIVIDRKSQIITIDVSDRSPTRAAAINQAYVEELNRTLAQVSTSSARRERIFVEGRLQSVNRDLETAEKDFSQFASRSSTIDIKEQGKALFEVAAAIQGELIAARSELEGLRQLYSDSNVRVRAVQARVAELESQLKKVGGGDDNSVAEEFAQSDSLYPSMRKLPLMGVMYADLYRKAKIQEAVFETLTREYELAKVQEAKEIPTVKVLDLPNVPEKKSFPPHMVIMLMGTILAFSGGVAWTIARTRWEQTDSADPGKILAQEVFHTLRAAVPWAARNGRGHDAESSSVDKHNKPPKVKKRWVR
jgi:capsule polysaccharide export protein KpsE/RkpR